jgi:hypothetical protein
MNPVAWGQSQWNRRKSLNHGRRNLPTLQISPR